MNYLSFRTKSSGVLRAISLVLCLCIMFSLVACDGDSAASSKPSSSTASGSSATGQIQSLSDLKGDYLIDYPDYDERIERDYMYDVSVYQGDKSIDLTCYNHCDAVVTSSRTVNGDMYRRFCEFAFWGSEVRVDITVYSDFESYTVMPSAKEFRSERNGNVISVYLDEPDYFLLKLDASDDSILSVFADAPEINVPDKDDEDVIYIDGWYEPEGGATQLVVYKSNSTVYLAPGSVLNARLQLVGDNITVKGRGMILDPYSDIYATNKTTYDSYRYLVHVTGSFCTIEDIKMVDARDFNLWVECEGLEVTNLKILASEMCTDGITITSKSGSGGSFKHCFLYVADNALVLSASKETSVFDDITIGTICCGIFPQNNAGSYEISNVYIFRADEGVMRNCYNWQSQQRSFSLTLNNVSAVDCDHFPFIFYGYNMGTLPKSITFNNLSVPVATGSNNLGQGNGNTIRIENVAGKIDTNNYALTFNGLSIGGKAVTDASQLKTYMTDGNTVNVTGNGSSFGPALPATNKVSVKPEGKIFIGERQLFAKDRAVNKDNTWYVPAADVCEAVGKAVPSATTNINGVKYISLANLVSSGVAKSASYDKASGRINIAVPDGATNDLLSWFGNEAHSHWSEYVSYNMHMVYLHEYGDNSFSMEKCKKGAGISYNLTPQMQQYGAGTYTLTFSAKADSATSMQVVFGSNRKFSYKTASLSTEWKEFSFTYDETTDPSTIFNACLMLYANEDNKGIEIRNAKLVYNAN